MIHQPASVFIQDYTYNLPPEQIALTPLKKRDDSKLLLYENGEISDHRFFDLSQFLPQNATLVLNDTRVLEARILFQKDTGAKIELFCLEPFNQSMESSLAQTGTAQWLCLVGGASKWKPGQVLHKKIIVEGKEILLSATYVEKQTESFLIRFHWEPAEISFVQVMHAAGNMPLPPYIKRAVMETDKERYQTVFSRQEGSVAAPTAALHFTHQVFDQLTEKNILPAYVTLHVGAGTFKPVKTETIAGHHMHGEPFSVSKQTLQQLITAEKIIAVGTTSLRTLESLYWLGIKCLNGLIEQEWKLEQWEAYELAEQYENPDYRTCLTAILDYLQTHELDTIWCYTSLLIMPGYTFHLPHALITNFHQPQSTLLLLVAAFIGADWKKVYAHALENNYRFLSYGDSSLLWKNEQQEMIQ